MISEDKKTIEPAKELSHVIKMENELLIKRREVMSDRIETPENFKKTLTISDRRQAIKTACKFSETGDILLIAGKGHETYQEINGVRIDFDDLAIVKGTLEELEK